MIIDPTGKVGKERRDALGRLSEVIEAPNGLNYNTTYTYTYAYDADWRNTVVSGTVHVTNAYDGEGRRKKSRKRSNDVLRI